MRRFWDQMSPGEGYDAAARRKGTAVEVPATIAPVKSGGLTVKSAGAPGRKTPVGGALMTWPDLT